MSDKQKSFLKLLIGKVYDQKGETNITRDQFEKDMIVSLLNDKAQLDSKKGKANDKKAIEECDSLCESLTKDELYFCITRVNCDYLITDMDRRRVRVYFSDGVLTNYKINYNTISKLLDRTIEARETSPFYTDKLTDSDYMTLLKKIGRLTYNRIRNFKCDSRDQIITKNDKYEIGYEHYAQIYYIKYYYLFMLDVDSLDDEVLERIDRFCQTYPRYLFALYRTTKGYHLFCLSHTINHQTPDNVLLQDELHGDPWYTTFSYNYGYKVRISHKKDSSYDMNVAKFIKNIGSGLENPYCRKMLNIHDKLISLDLQYDTPIASLDMNHLLTD